MAEVITISSGEKGTQLQANVNLFRTAVGVAAIGAAYYVATKFDLVQRAEAVFYGFPTTRAQAIQSAKVLQNLLAYAQQVGDTGLANLVQGRLAAIAQRYPEAVAGTTSTPTPTGTTAGGQTTIGGQQPQQPGGRSIVSGAPPTPPPEVLNAAQITQVPIPTDAAAAHNALISLDLMWWQNQGTNLAAQAHIEAEYIRQLFPNAGPAGGYTWQQLRRIFPELPEQPPSVPAIIQSQLGSGVPST